MRIAVKQKAKNHEKKASRSQDNSPLPGSPMNLEGEAGEWKAGAWRRPKPYKSFEVLGAHALFGGEASLENQGRRHCLRQLGCKFLDFILQVSQGSKRKSP
jgi:hypothetical protein